MTQKAVQVEEGSNCVVFGSNSLALIIAYALKQSDKCDKVVLVGAPHLKDFVESFNGIFIEDAGAATDVQKQLMTVSDVGFDYTFECTRFKRWGTVALEVCHKGFGRCSLLSRPEKEDETIST